MIRLPFVWKKTHLKDRVQSALNKSETLPHTCMCFFNNGVIFVDMSLAKSTITSKIYYHLRTFTGINDIQCNIKQWSTIPQNIENHKKTNTKRLLP